MKRPAPTRDPRWRWLTPVASGLSRRTSLALWGWTFLAGTRLWAAEEIPELHPPRDVLEPSFWQQHGWLVTACALFAAGMVALLVWRLRRSRPRVTVPPDIAARRALEALVGRAEDPVMAQEVARLVRQYVIALYALRRDELTTDELLGEVRAQLESSPGLLADLGTLLRECDARRFAPVPPRADEGIATRALNLADSLEMHRRPASEGQSALPAPAPAPNAAS